MTKKLEDIFDVPSLTALTAGLKTNEPTPEPTTEEEIVSNSVAKLSELESQLDTIGDLTDHDKAMDEFAETALDSYKTLMEKGGECEDRDAGKIFDAAVHMLKNAIDAKNSKVTAKLKKFELALKAYKTLNDANKDDDGTSEVMVMSRDEILDALKQDKNK